MYVATNNFLPIVPNLNLSRGALDDLVTNSTQKARDITIVDTFVNCDGAMVDLVPIKKQKNVMQMQWNQSLVQV